MKSKSPLWEFLRGCLIFGGILLVLVSIPAFFFLRNVEAFALADATWTRASFDIQPALQAYAKDHQGTFPSGHSSTEVFQTLLDGGYLADPSVLYVSMEGKVRAEATTKTIRPENVCWDVTGGINATSPDRFPVLFLTGFKVTYLPGASATLRHPLRHTFFGSTERFCLYFLKSGGGTYRRLQNGTVSNFIPADFDPAGHTYRQLTPDGELKP